MSLGYVNVDLLAKKRLSKYQYFSRNYTHCICKYFIYKYFTQNERLLYHVSQLECTIYVIDTGRVFLPECPFTTIRSRFSADELQIVRGEAEDTNAVRPHLKAASNGCKRTLWEKKRVHVSDL